MNKNKASIVVGLGYGDEGKGMTVNELCKAGKKPIVIRYSGGQQAGHTVHVGDIKHTCSNFGSGVLLDVPTYFSEHTTFYPVTIAREMEVLKSKGIKYPVLVFHPMAKITTPWDVYDNRNCDKNVSHGTCGLGVGKTMHRSIKKNLNLTAIDLMHMPTFKEKLIQIEMSVRNTCVPMPDWFERDMEEFIKAIKVLNFAVADYEHLLRYDNLIFEGSQGVLLDKDHGSFPNVTYANTTSKNAMEVCDKLKIKDRHVYCVTRAYHTRHGEGCFHDDEIELQFDNHETNYMNEWQGPFKIARLDYELVDYGAAIETLYSKGYPQTLMVTCCNQMHEEDKFDAMLLCSEWFNIKVSNSVYGEFKNY